MVKKYLINILIGLDQLANTITGGSPDETISSRVGRNYKGSWLEAFIDGLFGRGHCQANIEPIDRESDAILK